MAEPARQRVNEQNAEPAQLELVAAPATPPLQRERDPEQLHLSLLRVVESVRETVQAIHASQRTITEELRGIKTSLPMQRRPLSRRTQSIHLHATLTRRNGLCACCQETPVCTDTGRLSGAEYDHFFARDKNRVSQTWLGMLRVQRPPDRHGLSSGGAQRIRGVPSRPEAAIEQAGVDGVGGEGGMMEKEEIETVTAQSIMDGAADITARLTQLRNTPGISARG